MSAAETSASNDKAKYIILGVIGSVAILYALYTGVFGPMQAQKVKMKASLEDLDSKLNRAKVKVGRVPTMEKRIISQNLEIYNLSDIYVLKHQLGNYFIQVKEYISLVAQDSKIRISNISEGGIEEYPRAMNRRSPNTLKIYNVQLNMVGGLHSLIRFLKYIETDNPYLGVASLKIASNETTPSTHKIALNLTWPIWINDEYMEKYSQPPEMEDDDEN
jgi:hypothetical protein